MKEGEGERECLVRRRHRGWVQVGRDEGWGGGEGGGEGEDAWGEGEGGDGGEERGWVRERW